MWEWLLLIALVILFLYMTSTERPSFLPKPGCRACAKQSENPGE